MEAEIPVAPVLTPFQHGKPFVTEEEEKSLGTQMFNLHRWYLRMSNDQGKIFGVKYRDHDFFRGEDNFWVYFENLYHIYHRQALDASIITIWVLYVSLTSTLILFVNKNIIICVHYKFLLYRLVRRPKEAENMDGTIRSASCLLC